MIPAGYAASIVLWATRPQLTSEEMAARQSQLLDEHDALVSGQVSGEGKASRTLTAGTYNGKSFTWLPDLTNAEKLAVLGEVIERLGLAGEAAPVRMTYGAFSTLQR